MASLVERVTLRVADKSTATARPCKKALREAMPAGMPRSMPSHQASRQAHGDGVTAPSIARGETAPSTVQSDLRQRVDDPKRGRAEPEGPAAGLPEGCDQGAERRRASSRPGPPTWSA